MGGVMVGERGREGVRRMGELVTRKTISCWLIIMKKRCNWITCEKVKDDSMFPFILDGT